MKTVLKALGLTILVFLVATLLRATAMHFFPRLYGRQNSPPVTTVVTPAQRREETPQTFSPAILPKTETNTAEKEKPIYATGRVWSAKDVMVIMSDGSVRSMRDNTDKEHPRLTIISKHFMDFDGQRLWFKPHVEAQSSFAADIERKAAVMAITPPPTPPAKEEKKDHTEDKEDTPAPEATYQGSVQRLTTRPLRIIPFPTTGIKP